MLNRLRMAVLSIKSGLWWTNLALLCKLWERIAEKSFMRDVVSLFADVMEYFLKTNAFFSDRFNHKYTRAAATVRSVQGPQL